MDNLTKYKELFEKIFDVEEDELENLEYQGVDTWDSVGHIEMIVEIEDAFHITMKPEDMMDFLSYKKGIELLRKYGIEM